MAMVGQPVGGKFPYVRPPCLVSHLFFIFTHAKSVDSVWTLRSLFNHFLPH